MQLDQPKNGQFGDLGIGILVGGATGELEVILNSDLLGLFVGFGFMDMTYM